MLKRMKLFVGTAVMIGAMSAQAPAALQGTWHSVEAKLAGPNGQVRKLKGVTIFTGKYYSEMFESDTRTQPPDLAKATADELRAVFNPFTANSGTYEVSGNRLVRHPEVAKNPNIMRPGTNQTFTFRIEGNRLYLTQQGTDNTGKAVEGTTFTLEKAN